MTDDQQQQQRRPVLSAAALLGRARITEDEVPIGGDGVVRVRALTRQEAVDVRAAGDTPAEQEPLILRLGVVDPPLTDADVKAWMTSAPAGEIQPVIMRIAELSGMAEDQPKQFTKSVRRRR